MSTIKSMTDEELVLAYIDGNNKAFDELLSRNGDKVFTYIMCNVKDDDLANDLFQEVFLKVVHKLQNRQYYSNGKFLCWVIRIAHNVMMDHWRAQHGGQVAVDVSSDKDVRMSDGEPLTDISREVELSNNQTLKDVVLLMNSLPEVQRQVVYMRYFQNLSFKEIAEETHVSINTSLGRMRYALINMRRMSRKHHVNLVLE